jgi:hypothetical protein
LQKNKKEVIMTSLNLIRLGFAALLLSPLAAGAATDTASTTVNAVLGSTISISSTSPVNLNITPVSGGAQTTASDTVSVSTNNAGGYFLTLEDGDATTNLVNGGNNITAHAGTQASPTALANNTWGYRVDTVGGFGAGPTSGSSNQTTNSSTFAGVPASGSPNTLKTTGTTASGDTTTVWYSAKADTTKPNGTYADTVTYTATTN